MKSVILHVEEILLERKFLKQIRQCQEPSLQYKIKDGKKLRNDTMAKTENDTIYFLILWLIAMFLTLAAGIIVIMYQVRCFPCQNNEVGAEHGMHHNKHGGHHSDFHPNHLDPKNMRTCMVCGEVMSTEEEGEIHQSCHDVDVMCV